MKKIAHRGNLEGPSERENHPQQIEAAVGLGYDAEVDVWWIAGNELWLGHDSPTHKITWDWLSQLNPRLWIHCKSPQTLLKFKHTDFHFFWHDLDTYTITSKGVIWSRPGALFDQNVVVLMPELSNSNFELFVIESCYGVCTDFPIRLTF